MTGADKFEILLGLGIGTVLFVLIGTLLVKAFARSLGLGRAFLISLAGVAAFAVPNAIQCGFEIALGMADDNHPVVDWSVAVFGMIMAAMAITHLAKNSGIQKAGWIGLGEKAVLTTFGLSMALFAAFGGFSA